MDGSSSEIILIREHLPQFRHGTVEIPQERKPIRCCGLEVIRKGSSVGLTQDSTHGKDTADKEERRVRNQCHLAHTCRNPKCRQSVCGGLIWMIQPRFGLAYWVVQLSTSTEPALFDDSIARSFLLDCERAAAVLLGDTVTVSPHPLPESHATMAPQLIISPTMGTIPSRIHSQPQAFFAAYGIPISRDGVVTLHAHPIARQTRKMKRVSRFTLAAEAVSIATAIDFSYRLRASLVEFTAGAIETAVSSCSNPPR